MPEEDAGASDVSAARSEAGAAPGALEEATEVRRMFGRIVRRYDVVNRLMTAGRDVRWRYEAARLALGEPGSDARVLDVATGTGDLALALVDEGAAFVVGLDFAAPMVRAAKEKGQGRLAVSWVVGDALCMPFPDNQFDACTVAFGLRNMASYEQALREMARVIRPGGRLVCLELTPLRRPVVGKVFNWYFTRIVPVIGGFLSGDPAAYQYLPRSVAAFPTADELAALMRRAGFAHVSFRLRGGGTVALHVALKSRARDA